jgi:hypothetical protein
MIGSCAQEDLLPAVSCLERDRVSRQAREPL